MRRHGVSHVPDCTPGILAGGQWMQYRARKAHQQLASKARCLQVRSMLVCGADVLESFIKPGVWLEEQVRQILGDHGVVCMTR